MKKQHIEQPTKKQHTLYASIWRWHFYAGLIFSPILILLAITGAIYLFKPQIEEVMYKDLYQVSATDRAEKQSAEQLLQQIKKEYSDMDVLHFTPSLEPERTAQAKLMVEGEMTTLFVDPYRGEIVGSLTEDDRFMNQIVALHGELMIGTLGDRLVELAASWALILVVTGLYLWWPRQKKALFGTLLPRLGKGTNKRTRLRDLHAVPAFWLSFLIVILILTGLPWAGVVGEKINEVATYTNSGYPEEMWEQPQSTLPTKDVADNVAWAAEEMPVPESGDGKRIVSVDQVIEIAAKSDVEAGYSISLPQEDTGVYTVSVFPEQPERQATLHIDQYSGKVLADLRFSDYGTLAKIISIGIALHEGHYFGVINQVIALITCLGLIGIVATGIWMWWKRKPAGKFGAPPAKPLGRWKWGVLIILLIFGLILPLVGISLVVILLLDLVTRLIVRWKGKRA
ncbi:PepSY domain-containing protein [Mechercharimyces sp. CAU 1602]|uniref:PepSY-associated TM helix domain-containing protein n=1 Tax=Mechercharimyces sp. CAU 1602 TaxID=2973933 RepID=UPI0021625A78|nr:PepSY domain-containing protein [Mechercharimyces sp. CAU 1602]MCS1351027.1 PepSY domain-containing protein [Mechercharimyces sp. CAU 1602]